MHGSAEIEDRSTIPGEDRGPRNSEAPSASRVYEVDPLRDPRWAALVDAHPLASVFHTREWLSALVEAYGYRPLVQTTAAPDAPLTGGIAFCEVKSWLTGRRLVGLPFSDHCEPLVDSPDELETLLAHARRLVEDGTYKRMEIRPQSTQSGEEWGLEPQGGIALHRLDLRLPEDKLFRSFHKDCIQRKIRRAERENLVYEEGRSEELLTEFYRLMTVTRRRHRLPPQPLGWFRALITAFGESLKIRVARKDGVAVASILTIAHRRVMTYKYGCSDAAANKYGGTPMLFWRTIQEAKANGQEELDMGRSDLEDPGLSAFKEHWGAVATPLTYWRFPATGNHPQPAWQKKASDWLISVSPDRALQLAGHLLYRHIG